MLPKPPIVGIIPPTQPTTTVGSLFSELRDLVNAVNTADDTWISSLRSHSSQFNEDPVIKTKMDILENLDDALVNSFKVTPAPINILALSGLVIELEGYKRLSQRYFSDLRDLTVNDRDLEQAAFKARTALFDKLDQVQQWLQNQNEPIKPSAFDTCTDLFLNRLPANSTVLKFTQQLFSKRHLELSDAELRALINAWGDAISKFVEDTQDTIGLQDSDGLEFGELPTLESFFCMHDRLDTLYSRLSTNVSRN